MYINYTKHQIYNDDIKEVVKTLKKEQLTQGKKVNELENALNKKFKSKYCNVVSSGTAALHLAGKVTRMVTILFQKFHLSLSFSLFS